MTVKELTGDMQLSKNELEETQVTFYQILHAQYAVVAPILFPLKREKNLTSLLSCYSDDSYYT